MSLVPRNLLNEECAHNLVCVIVISGVRLCWELEEPKGLGSTPRHHRMRPVNRPSNQPRNLLNEECAHNLVCLTCSHVTIE